MAQLFSRFWFSLRFAWLAATVLLELRPLLHETLGETWTWDPAATDANGLPLSRVYTELAPANLFSRDDWPALISFFKPRLIALDAFWADAQYAFEALK